MPNPWNCTAFGVQIRQGKGRKAWRYKSFWTYTGFDLTDNSLRRVLKSQKKFSCLCDNRTRALLQNAFPSPSFALQTHPNQYLNSETLKESQTKVLTLGTLLDEEWNFRSLWEVEVRRDGLRGGEARRKKREPKSLIWTHGTDTVMDMEMMLLDCGKRNYPITVDGMNAGFFFWFCGR